MSTELEYKKGLKVWIPHVNKVWELAVILEDYDSDTKNLVVETESDHQIKTLIIKSNTDLPAICYSEDFVFDERKNLASLRVLHEACIINTLRSRFDKQCFYNYCGATTVFLNPFVKPTINELDNIFNNRGQIDFFINHIFAVAEKIYCRLKRENRDQSIIFTGKTGAGKTENANLAAVYLLNISAKDDQIIQNIYASSIILESFGNAKKINNNDSSRFGKFIEMQYDANYRIIGASLTAFLLDRSRLVFQTQNEQNFNIFYELHSVKERFSHLQMDEQEFNYLNRGDSADTYLNYSKRFNEVLTAFNVLGFTVRQQEEILLILAVILHLGNLHFKKLEIAGMSQKSESCFISGYSTKLEMLVLLFSLEPKGVKSMRKWMTHRRHFSGQTEILQPMSVEEAKKGRDTLAKFLYSKLFSWIVARINFLFRSPCNVRSFIGILDVCGFEMFNVNLFEQFCINYTNEKIQQNFIQSAFKSEQEEYLREDINWTFIRYQDNRLCTELLEGKCGIIEILDEETKAPGVFNGTWVDILYTKFETAKHFKKPENSSTDFIIRHFVDSVRYDSREFLEKNRDTVFREHLIMLKETKNEILNKIVMDEYNKASLPREKRRSKYKPRVSLSTHQTKKTVLSEIKKSLTAVTSTIQSTSSHYVICVKSNDESKPYEFDPACVAQQIRSYNILDAIQISAVGYFSRQSYTEFFHRYYCLCQFEGIKRDDLHETCRMIVYTYIEDENKVKFGKTKIFLKEEVIEYLEAVRQEKQHRASILIQKTVRCFLQRKRYQQIRHSALGLQSIVRGYLARRRVRDAAEYNAAVKIQTCVREWMSRRRQERFERIALTLQNHAKFYLERNNVDMDEAQLMRSAATEIQKLCRGFLARRIREKRLRDIITIQACVRRFLAKIAADKLRKSRDERIQLLNKSLQTKIDALQQKIDTCMKKNLTTKQLEEVKMIVDDQQCTQAKNRILNQILFDKIQILKGLGEKSEKKAKAIDKPAVSQQLSDIKAKTIDMPVINEKSLYEESRVVNKSSLSEVFKSVINEDEDFKSYQPLFQRYFNFDQRIERITRAFNYSRAQLAQSSSPRRNENNQLEYAEINNYQGMFEFNASDINVILTRLIIDLQPSIIMEHEPGTPSRIIFMCLRYLDNQGDFNSASQMLQNYVKAVKHVIKRRGDLKTIIVWLVNTHQLLNYLKQYAKVHNNVRDQFHTFNTDRQTQQCFNKLDLTSRWGSLLETAQWLVRAAEKLMKITISELALLGLLQYNPVTANYSDRDEEREDDVDTQMADEDKLEMQMEMEEEMEYTEKIEQRVYDQEGEQEQNQDQTEKQDQEPNEKLKWELPKPQAQDQEPNEKLKWELPKRQVQDQKDELPQQFAQEHDQLQTQEQEQKQETIQQHAKKQMQEENHKFLQQQVQERIQEEIQSRNQKLDQYQAPAQIQVQEQNQAQELLQQQDQAYGPIQDQEQVQAQELLQQQNQARGIIRDQEQVQAQDLPQQQDQAYGPIENQEQVQEQEMAQQQDEAYGPIRNQKQVQAQELPQQQNQAYGSIRDKEQVQEQELTQQQDEAYGPIENQEQVQVQELLQQQDQAYGSIRDHEQVQAQELAQQQDQAYGLIRDQEWNQVQQQFSEVGYNENVLRFKRDTLLKKLTDFHYTMRSCGLDRRTILQMFKQLFDFISTILLSNILSRPELCNCYRGSLARLNLNTIDEWALYNDLSSATIVLGPIKQALRLLQMQPLHDHEICWICKYYDKLNCDQILTILSCYKPAYAVDQPLSPSVMSRLQLRLSMREEHENTVLLDAENFAISFSFRHCDFKLEEVEIPEAFNLPMLRKI